MVRDQSDLPIAGVTGERARALLAILHGARGPMDTSDLYWEARARDRDLWLGQNGYMKAQDALNALDKAGLVLRTRGGRNGRHLWRAQ